VLEQWNIKREAELKAHQLSLLNKSKMDKVRGQKHNMIKMRANAIETVNKIRLLEPHSWGTSIKAEIKRL